MRSRSRSLYTTKTWNRSSVSKYHHIYYGYTNYTRSNSWANSIAVFDRVEAITDSVSPTSTKLRAWERPLHECAHTSTKFVLGDSISIRRYKTSEGWDETEQFHYYDDPLAFLYFEKSGTQPGENPMLWNSPSEGASIGTLPQVDWTALKSSFYEAVDSLVPQSFFFGEDAVESPNLFRLAFDSLLRPSKAVKTTLHLLRDVGRRGRTLGSLRKIVKGMTNGHLLWQFAIKPAIHDIRATLDAHSVIEERLRFIESHRGTFVPIRVKQKQTASLDYGTPPARSSSVVTTWLQPSSNTRRACISAYGKVRSDITVQPRWAAYMEYFGLNKVVGTAWELIPFSFIVDWFSNAQERINDLTRLRVSDPYTEIRNIMYSIKDESVWTLFAQTPEPWASYTSVTPTDAIKIGDITNLNYNRTFSCPDGSSFFTSPYLSTGKVVSLGSLLLQRSL